MKTLTECVNQLKKNLQGLSGTAILIQSYEGLDVPLMEDDDSKLARIFSETLQNNLEVDETSFNNPYSKRALQAAWNFADILSIALTYIPQESSPGLLRGLFAQGTGKKLNITLLSTSIDYLDTKNMLPTPYIIDDVTNSINLYLIDFINNVRNTKNGSSLLKTLSRTCQMISSQTISIDEMIINTATERVTAYKIYKNSLPSTLELSEEEEELFFDAIEPQLEFYDTYQAKSSFYSEAIKEQAKRKINTLNITIELSINIETQRANHRTAQSEEDKKYCFLLRCLGEVKEFTMNPKHDLQSICEHILNDEPLKTAFQELPDTANQRVRIVDYLKKCLNDLLELCGFGRPFVERKRHGLTLFDTYKKQIKDTLDGTDKAECDYPSH